LKPGDLAHERDAEPGRIAWGDEVIGLGEVGEEEPVAAAVTDWIDAEERGLVAQLVGEVEQARVEGDPDGRLQEHGQAAEDARRS
jgi:hypothetical protein